MEVRDYRFRNDATGGYPGQLEGVLFEVSGLIAIYRDVRVEALRIVAGRQVSCTIQHPVADCFRQMVALNALRTIQIRDGACQFQYAVKGACRELQFFHCLAE